MMILHAFGIVQGVGFRPYVWNLATSLNLAGYVQNKGSYVEIAIEGPENNIISFIDSLTSSLPPHARIDSLEKKSVDDAGFDSFTIIDSVPSRSNVASGIPPDIAVCAKCKKEMFSESDSRYLYPFINCTACGPRFTIISSIPYDRKSTTMGAFELCSNCKSEYIDPKNRRYHAEPIACSNCGPMYKLVSFGVTNDKNPFRKSASLIDEGNIIAVKGYGGFHLACDATNKSAVTLLRDTLGRPNQPFAVMSEKYHMLDDDLVMDDTIQLCSSSAPIMLFDKKHEGILADNIAPGLEQIGLMMPYAPVHLLLFSYLSTPCIVMTSANYPGHPMMTTLSEAQRSLNGIDHFLTHNLTIRNRCDDSVKRKNTFVRRSRGYVPSFLPVPHSSTSVAFGAELNNVMACSHKGKCMLTQHIGDTSNWDVLMEGVGALKTAMNFSGIERSNLSYVACDLHPTYHTSLLASEWADELGIPCIKIQHHFAHGYGILGEHGLDEVLCIAADGIGYGEDGNIWGGEVLYSSLDHEDSSRLGHLGYIPMPGGDLATRYPLRLLLPHLDESQLELYQDTMGMDMDSLCSIKKYSLKNGPFTSSSGRFLDSVSAMIGVCVERTYEGEPAMKLEAAALGGKDIGLRMDLDGPIPCIGEFLSKLSNRISNNKKCDIAMTAHVALAQAFLDIVSYYPDIHAPLGFTGGVAVNAIISHELRKGATRLGRILYEHKLVPPGDGGISYGQSCMDITR